MLYELRKSNNRAGTVQVVYQPALAPLALDAFPESLVEPALNLAKELEPKDWKGLSEIARKESGGRSAHIIFPYRIELKF